jgi:ATP-dependent protease HslVU (ClpYQ) peptidase subunit
MLKPLGFSQDIVSIGSALALAKAAAQAIAETTAPNTAQRLMIATPCQRDGCR